MDEESGDLFLLKILKSLKPKGRLLISTPINKSKIKTNLTPYHIREYDDIEFKQKLIKNGFTIISMFGQGDSKYYNKLYGKNILNFSMFDIMRTGIHLIFPKFIRQIIKNLYFGKMKRLDDLKITEHNWNNQGVQIALCEYNP